MNILQIDAFHWNAGESFICDWVTKVVLLDVSPQRLDFLMVTWKSKLIAFQTHLLLLNYFSELLLIQTFELLLIQTFESLLIQTFELLLIQTFELLLIQTFELLLILTFDPFRIVWQL